MVGVMTEASPLIPPKDWLAVYSFNAVDSSLGMKTSWKWDLQKKMSWWKQFSWLRMGWKEFKCQEKAKKKKMKGEMEEWKPGKGLLGVHLQSLLKCQHQHRVILVYSCRAWFGRLTLGHRYNRRPLWKMLFLFVLLEESSGKTIEE